MEKNGETILVFGGGPAVLSEKTLTWLCGKMRKAHHSHGRETVRLWRELESRAAADAERRRRRDGESANQAFLSFFLGNAITAVELDPQLRKLWGQSPGRIGFISRAALCLFVAWVAAFRRFGSPCRFFSPYYVPAWLEMALSGPVRPVAGVLGDEQGVGCGSVGKAKGGACGGVESKDDNQARLL